MASLKSMAKPLLPALLLAPGALMAQGTDPVWDFYGQLDLGVISTDDGFGSETAFTDNDNSNSRVGLIFKQGLDNGSEFRFHFETALGLTGSSALSGDDTDFDAEYHRTEIRKLEFIYDTASIGKFSFGQGTIATDGAAGSDLSGTGLIANVSLDDLAGSQEFRLSNGAASGISVGDGFSSLDGSRRFRVRYDSPTYNGFGFALSAGKEVLTSGNDNEYFDFGVNYEREYGDFEVASAIGYSFRDSAEELLAASAAALHKPTGLSLAVAAGQQKEGDDSYVYVKGGLQRDWFSVGRTYLSLDYYAGEDFAITGSESSSVGLAVVQDIEKYDVELYATYRSYEFESAGSAYEDLDVTFVGARWKF
ncbi:MAG: porin [Sulfitobacter sp.]